ncbi:hypothetical protein ASD22_11640 [Rhodanobacter sp. Root480]|uniref:DUF2239 family protein n=1 Tax=Rhodanobacter sp. Root480 TaxID=1736542 RepID=UPI000701D7B8|nr:DUF2239 family protein [Rhodanobacter sp. Root480]KQX97847.1 hypothetical protein ASD22_11640 [Rhodanobacter sp. Root480]
MKPSNDLICSAFDHRQLIASGPLAEVVRATRQALDAGAAGPILIFDDRTSQPVEVDFRGSLDEVMARLPSPPSVAPRGPGRPRLGVVAREVTLLPRHWDWLGQQSGGVSGALRRLVEHATRQQEPQARARQAQEATDRFMRVMAGDLAGYEEASRALYRGERERFAELTAKWPTDVRQHLLKLAAGAWTPE